MHSVDNMRLEKPIHHAIPAVPLGVLTAFCCLSAGAAEGGPLEAFATGGHSVYHLRCARVQPVGERAIVVAALDGAVLCFARTGELIWKNQANASLPLDLDVADIDGDGLDETLVASADGGLYVLDHAGDLRWRFHREPPLLQVRAVTGGRDGTVILAGGVEKKLYALSPEGRVLETREVPYIVRHIRAGRILGGAKPYAAVVTAKNDKSRFFLQVFDPDGLRPLWEEPVGLSTHNPTEGTTFHVPWLGYRVSVSSMLILDVNGDGKEEMLLSDHFEKRGAFSAYNHKGEKILTSSIKGIRGRPYRMNLLSRVRLPGSREDRVLGLFGNQIVLYGLDGSIETILDSDYSLACCEFDPETSTCYLGSSISGGDGVYALHLDRPGWESGYRDLKPVGRLAQVERNLAVLAEQVERFERPEYQRSPRNALVVTGKSFDELRDLYLDDHDYENVEFALFNLFTEDYDRDVLEGVWKTKRETRHKYNFSAEEIIAYAAEREARHEPFALWAGHGNDPFYMQLSTIAGILEAAPTMAKALVFPEMERTDADMDYAVQAHILPIADLCRKQGVAKIVLRNKNIFWNASCYLDLWRETLLGGRYGDVFIPSMEETNGRTQAISLSGRMGLWLTGRFDRLSARAVTDNANFSRLWEWSSQQSLGHLLRSLALRASLGADMFLVNIYHGDPKDLTPFYRMLEKGVIAIPERDDLLSVADVCLGMKPPSPSFLEHGKNGHDISAYEPGGTPAVFDRLDCYWGGAPTAPHDFSRYAMGSRARMLNFLPRNPYGLIASVPADTDLEAFPRFKSMIVTDGESFFDDQGRAVSAPDYKPRVEGELRASAARLPIRVRGDVAWTVVRLDPGHVRVTLIDPGYTDPADREAEIVLQRIDGTACRDILSGEDLPLREGSVTLTVPAGVLRVVDVAHGTPGL
jgi:hypothetical protein